MDAHLTVVVTGASRGLGAGLTRAFAAAGHRVATCARHVPAVGDLRMAVDVREADAVGGFLERAVAELGPVDLWVSNAGVLEPIAPVRDLDVEAFRTVLDVNLMGALHCTKAYLEHRRRLGSGCLVTISSGAASTAIRRGRRTARRRPGSTG